MHAAPTFSSLDDRSGSPVQSVDQLLTYDPAAIAHYYRSRPLQIFLRLVELVWTFLGFSLDLLWDRQTGRQASNEVKRAIQLREVLTKLGPAYIKIGQALSTRPDLVPPAFMGELVKLQDQIPPFSNEIAFRLIKEDLGQIPQDIYAEISPNPVAAASLGQVYKGKLKTGAEVAIKVQRPGLTAQITRDIYLLRRLAQWACNNLSVVRSDLVSIMDEFGARIFEEMDYTHEGENAQRFESLYGYLPNIIVPKIYTELTARRVLTMEWINGTKLTEPEILEAKGLKATEIVEIGVQCSLRQLLEHGFFHADPHPGNLLVTDDGQLAYLDFGMMCSVESYQRYGLIEAIVHMVNRDFEGLANDYVKLEFLTPETDLSPIIPALATVFNNALGASVAELNLKSITDEFSALMYEYPFRVPAYYALIIRSLVTLDGIAISVDPDFKVLSKAYPYVAKRLLTDPAPELRQSLQELLFKDGDFRWNRLENLLRNARSSQDYDLEKVLQQTIDYLFSERGNHIRDHIADELAKSLDQFGHSLVQRLQAAVSNEESANASVAPGQSGKEWEHISRIVSLLGETKGMSGGTVVRLVPQVLSKPETRQMGQRVARNLAQRAAARLLRTLFLHNTSTPQVAVNTPLLSAQKSA
ncbi:abc-1 domain-containing protein [Leptolyngbya sp. Heron Island J]|uniref:ABC1 kinase family protein n=1 Tax=Leptolyngbya sp. Heron Island J TaxID=1385935 RepID=UPI0003B9F5C5|nr:AarF/ABC1/UbiB kinase family protein [Leptolyngbya sp. Heron Island J]ESA36241.1 abc-1 domain-containing protein [Leptolyngbya sp. Heron Island J]